MKHLSMLIFLGLSAVVSSFAQYSTASNTPDCFFSEVVTTATRTSTFDNRQLKCSVWKVEIVNTTSSTTAYSFDYSNTSTSWTTLGSGTVSATSAMSPATFSSSNPYFSVNFTSVGSGSVIVSVSGYTYQGPKNSPNFSGPDNVAYTILQDVASSTVTYIGTAKSIFDPVTNTSYAITAIQKKITDASGNMTSLQWADGDSNEDNVWANRASLTYK